MREIRPSGSEGGARFNPLSLPLSAVASRLCRVHLDTVLEFKISQQNPLVPDRRDALSYFGGAAASNVGRASRLPSRKNSVKMHPMPPDRRVFARLANAWFRLKAD
jgi:hypothetical protein